MFAIFEKIAKQISASKTPKDDAIINRVAAAVGTEGTVAVGIEGTVAEGNREKPK